MAKDGHFGNVKRHSHCEGGALVLLADGEGGLVVEDDALLGEGRDSRVAVSGDV